MGWPFQPSSEQKNNSVKAVTSKAGFLDKLLGKAKPLGDMAPEQTRPSQPLNQWDLPDESFDAVSKLLEETQQKAANQPLPTNPYRTSLTVDDEELPILSQMPQPQILSQPSQAPIVSQPVIQEAIKADWAFDGSKLNFGSQDNGVPDRSFESMTLDDEALSPGPLAMTQDALSVEIPESNVVYDMEPDVGFDEPEEDALDDYGLNISPQALPQGSSLKDLMDTNVLTFISSKPMSQEFKVELLSQPLKHEEQNSVQDEAQATLLPLIENEISVSFDNFQSVEVPTDFMVASDTNIDDWFNAPASESEQAFLISDVESTLDFEIQSVEDIPEEVFQEEGVFDSLSEYETALPVFSEQSLSNASAPVVNESSWFEQGLSEESAFDDPSVISIVDDSSFQFEQPMLEPPLTGVSDIQYYEDLTKEDDDFQVISLDGESESHPEQDSEFFSGKYQFSLDRLEEADLVAEPEEDLWMNFGAPEAEPVVVLESQAVNLGDGLFEFHSAITETKSSLDLDEDITSYQDFMAPDEVEMDDEVVFELTDSLETVKLPEPEMILFTSESLKDIPVAVQEAILMPVPETCLEPPPVASTNNPVQAKAMGFEANIRLQESRFTKRSIDQLVSQYFKANPE